MTSIKRKTPKNSCEDFQDLGNKLPTYKMGSCRVNTNINYLYSIYYTFGLLF